MDYDPEDEAMAYAEREGKRLKDILCDTCSDPGLCGAEGECMKIMGDDSTIWGGMP